MPRGRRVGCPRDEAISASPTLTDIQRSIGRIERSHLPIINRRVVDSEEAIREVRAAVENIEVGGGDVDTSLFASAEGLESLTARVDVTETGVTSNRTLIDANSASLTSLMADVAGKAAASAVTELTARVTTNEGGILQNTTDITSVSNLITSLTTEVAGKAAAMAVTDLTARVAVNEASILDHTSSITTNTQSLTNLTSEIAEKAAASAVSALTTRVTANETAITGHDGRIVAAESSLTTESARIDTLTTEVDGKASASAVDTLTTRVTTVESDLTAAEANIAAESAQVDALTASIANIATSDSLIALTNRVTVAEGVVETASERVEALTAEISPTSIFTGEVEGDIWWRWTGQLTQTTDTVGEPENSFIQAMNGNASEALPTERVAEGATAYFTRLRIWEDGDIALHLGTSPAFAAGSDAEFTDAVEDAIRVALKYGDETVYFALGDDRTEPYSWRASNASDVGAFVRSILDEDTTEDITVVLFNGGLDSAVDLESLSVGGQASADALQVLEGRVTRNEGSLETQANSVTGIETSVMGLQSGAAANATAVEALTTRVEASESGLVSAGGRLDEVEAAITSMSIFSPAASDEVWWRQEGTLGATVEVVGEPDSSYIDVVRGNASTALPSDIVEGGGTVYPVLVRLYEDGDVVVSLDDATSYTPSGSYTEEFTDVVEGDLEIAVKFKDETIHFGLGSDVEGPYEWNVAGVGAFVRSILDDDDKNTEEATIILFNANNPAINLEQLSIGDIAFGQAIRELDVRVEDNETTIDAQTSSVTAVQSSIASLNARTNTLTSVLGNLDTAINNINTTIGGINTSIGSINTNISSLDTDVTDVEGDVSTIQTALSTAEGAIDILESSLATAEGDIDTLETLTTNLRTDLDGLTPGEGQSTALSALTTRVTTIEGELDTAEANVGTLQTDLDTAEGNITTLSGSLNTAESEIDTLQSDLNTAEGNITTNAAGVSTNATAITALQSVVGGKADATAVSALTTRVTAVEGVNSTQTAAINSNVTSVTSLAARVDALDPENAGESVFDVDVSDDGSTGVWWREDVGIEVVSNRGIRFRAVVNGEMVSSALPASICVGDDGYFPTFLYVRGENAPSAENQITLRLGETATSSDSGQNLTEEVEQDLRIALKYKTNTVVFALGDVDTNEPYWWTPANSSDVEEFADTVRQDADVSTEQMTIAFVNSMTDLGISADYLTIGGIDNRVTAVANRVTSVEGGVVDLEMGLATKAAATDLASLTSRVTVNEGEIDGVQTGLASKADATALTALTTRVATVEGDNTTQTAAISANVTAVTALNASLGGKASQSDLDALETTVAGSATQSDLDTLEGTVGANSTALTALTTRVTSAEGEIDAESARIDALSALVNPISIFDEGAPGVLWRWHGEIASLTNTSNDNNKIARIINSNTDNALPEEIVEGTVPVYLTFLRLRGDGQVWLNLGVSTTNDAVAGPNFIDIPLTVAIGYAGDNLILDVEDTNDPYIWIAPNPDRVLEFVQRLIDVDASEHSLENVTVVLMRSDIGVDREAFTVGGSASANAFQTFSTQTQTSISQAQADITGAQSNISQAQSDISQAQSDITGVQTSLNTKASAASVTALSSTVDGKASQADLDTLEGDLDTLETTVTGVQGVNTVQATAIQALTTQVSSAQGDADANAASITALTATVGGKADASVVETLSARVDGVSIFDDSLTDQERSALGIWWRRVGTTRVEQSGTRLRLTDPGSGSPTLNATNRLPTSFFPAGSNDAYLGLLEYRDNLNRLTFTVTEDRPPLPSGQFGQSAGPQFRDPITRDVWIAVKRGSYQVAIPILDPTEPYAFEPPDNVKAVLRQMLTETASLDATILFIDLFTERSKIDPRTLLAGGKGDAPTVGTLEAQWGVKTSVGDLRGGVGLYNDGETVDFLVSANNFKMGAPGANYVDVFTTEEDDDGNTGVVLRSENITSSGGVLKRITSMNVINNPDAISDDEEEEYVFDMTFLDIEVTEDIVAFTRYVTIVE